MSCFGFYGLKTELKTSRPQSKEMEQLVGDLTHLFDLSNGAKPDGSTVLRFCGSTSTPESEQNTAEKQILLEHRQKTSDGSNHPSILTFTHKRF